MQAGLQCQGIAQAAWQAGEQRLDTEQLSLTPVAVPDPTKLPISSISSQQHSNTELVGLLCHQIKGNQVDVGQWHASVGNHLYHACWKMVWSTGQQTRRIPSVLATSSA